VSLKLLRERLVRAVKHAAERALSLEEIGSCVYAAGLVELLSARSTELDAELATRAVIALEPIARRTVQHARVQSDSDSRVTYHLSRIIGPEPGPWRCSCPGFAHRQHCKHIDRLGVSHGSSSCH